MQDLRDAEVAEAQTAVGEEDDVVGLDVAVDDALLVRVRERVEELSGVFERGLRAEAVAEPIVEGALSERGRDQEVAVDAGGVTLPTPNAWDFVRCSAPGNSLDLDLTHRVYE